VSAGWTVKELDVGTFGAALFRRHGITERSVLYVGSRGIAPRHLIERRARGIVRCCAAAVPIA
jgi:hypothetical protein